MYWPAPLGEGFTLRRSLKEEIFDFSLWNAERTDGSSTPSVRFALLAPQSHSQSGWATHVLAAAVASGESCPVCKKRSQKLRDLKWTARASLALGPQQNLPPSPAPLASSSPGWENRWDPLASSGKRLQPERSGWWPRGRSLGGAVETVRGAQSPAPAWGVERDGGAQPRQWYGATAAWPSRALRTIGVVAERSRLDRHPAPGQRSSHSAARIVSRVECSGSPGACRLLGTAGP